MGSLDIVHGCPAPACVEHAGSVCDHSGEKNRASSRIGILVIPSVDAECKATESIINSQRHEHGARVEHADSACALKRIKHGAPSHASARSVSDVTSCTGCEYFMQSRWAAWCHKAHAPLLAVKECPCPRERTFYDPMNMKDAIRRSKGASP